MSDKIFKKHIKENNLCEICSCNANRFQLIVSNQELHSRQILYKVGNQNKNCLIRPWKEGETNVFQEGKYKNQ